MGALRRQGSLWEILVPCKWNDGKPIRTRHHREWDRRVRELIGGLTVLKPAQGQWIYENQLYADRVIPVRLFASWKQMETIADITLQHYEQLAVMYYLISEDCNIRHATDEQKEGFIR